MRIAVIGAGIVGVSTALWLRRDGHEVTLFDRIEPGDPNQTSYGNAGLLARSSVIPVPTPGIMKNVPKMLFSKDGPLFMRWRYLPRLLPWLVPFLRGAKPEEVRRIAAALTEINGDSVDQHLALAKGTGAERFIQTGRYIFLYKDRDAYGKDAFGFSLRRELGFEFDEMDRDALIENDPNLGPAHSFGVSAPDHGWIINPSAYLAALFGEFLKLGGQFKHSEVDEITPGEQTTVTAAGEISTFDRAVISSGVWSRRLAEALGHRIPMESERGYHIMFEGSNIVPPCPYMIAGDKYAMTPMEKGVRCAGLVEFGGLTAKPSPKPLELFRRNVKRVYPSIEWDGEAHWMGHRPSTTDSLPMIGESTKARSIYFAFGAQHIGLTSGPKTGRLIADMIGGRRPNIDLSPFKTDRFDS